MKTLAKIMFFFTFMAMVAAIACFYVAIIGGIELLMATTQHGIDQAAAQTFSGLLMCLACIPAALGFYVAGISIDK